MVRSFYPWVENPPEEGPHLASPGMSAGTRVEESGPAQAPGAHETPELPDLVPHEARIAVVDDPSVAPRVSIVDPAPIRDYVETITQTTYSSAREQGGSIPFMVIREVVENLIHAYFTDPVVTILPGGNTIRFSDRGPGIRSKEQALEYGTTTATEAMKQYIRGVGSGLPYVLHFLSEKGGSLTIEDNLSSGTIITMSLEPAVSRETAGKQGQMAEQTSSFTPNRAYEPEMPSTPSVPSTPPVPIQGNLHLEEPERQILAYLRAHGSVGPTELAKAYGASLGTWSRRLSHLKVEGIVEKSGQKHYLTALGRQLADLLPDR